MISHDTSTLKNIFASFSVYVCYPRCHQIITKIDKYMIINTDFHHS